MPGRWRAWQITISLTVIFVLTYSGTQEYCYGDYCSIKSRGKHMPCEKVKSCMDACNSCIVQCQKCVAQCSAYASCLSDDKAACSKVATDCIKVCRDCIQACRNCITECQKHIQ